MDTIPFNRAVVLPENLNFVDEVIRESRIAGDGKYTKLCSEWMESRFSAKKVLLTTSCTAALEMAALLLELKAGDEVIMPSYTFVTTANAFVRCGAVPVFVDIRPDTMNIDEDLIEDAITEKTRAIVVVHYGGVACEMDTIMATAKKHELPVIEDAAQGVMATYKGRYLGTIGTFGCYSFHETKNYTMGEGGALVISDEQYMERAEIIREKGTNRTKFFRGEIDKYSWVDIGSSFLPSEINVAYLYGQLLIADEINADRLETWKIYDGTFQKLKENGLVETPSIPQGCEHNAHMYYLKLKDLEKRTDFIRHMRQNGVSCVFHYVPLHSSEAGRRYGRFHGEDRFTTRESERLVRLPLYYGMSEGDRRRIIQEVLKNVLL